MLDAGLLHTGQLSHDIENGDLSWKLQRNCILHADML